MNEKFVVSLRRGMEIPRNHLRRACRVQEGLRVIITY